MNYAELLQKRRSIRSFQDRTIPLPIIQEILHEACLAPSACNTQPWKFIIIQDKKLMKKISDDCKQRTLDLIEKHPGSPFCRFKEVFTNPEHNIFYNAPALILVVGENNYPFFHIDCACAASYLMFAATARELGTCWIGHAHTFEDTTLKKEISMPENYQMAAALILGYPESIPTPCERNAPIVLKTIGFNDEQRNR